MVAGACRVYEVATSDGSPCYVYHGTCGFTLVPRSADTTFEACKKKIVTTAPDIDTFFAGHGQFTLRVKLGGDKYASIPVAFEITRASTLRRLLSRCTFMLCAVYEAIPETDETWNGPPVTDMVATHLKITPAESGSPPSVELVVQSLDAM